MSNYFDVQNDEELLKLSELLPQVENRELLSIVGEADLGMKYDELIKQAFADQENRAFPVYTPADTIISALYINDQYQDVPEMIKEACQEALDEWGITEIKIEAPIEKIASTIVPEDVFLFPEQEKLPATDRTMLMKSASIAKTHIKTLSPLEKVTAAHQMVKIAGELGVPLNELPSEFQPYAMASDCHFVKLSQHITERLSVTESPDTQEGYRGLLRKLSQYAEEAGSMVSSDTDINTGIANELILLDKEAGLMNVFDALQDTFNQFNPTWGEDLTKEASETEDIIPIGGYELPLQKIACISDADIITMFGEEFAKEITSDGSLDVDMLEKVAEDLPANAQSKIGRSLSQF